jgi:glycosyltransferase involved in cell wall biosynthesis
MKILFTSHRFSPDMGGIEVNSQILASFFHNAGHQVRLATRTPGDCSQDSEKFPYPVIRQPGAWKLISAHLWADVVYQNNIELGSLWPWIFLRKPLVISIRTWIQGKDGRIRLVDRLKRWILTLADGVIAISEAVRIRTFPGAEVIGNPYRSNLFRRLDGLSRTKDFVFLGRLVSDKGVDILLGAFASCRAAFPGIRLTIVGEGPEKNALQALAANLGVSDSVEFAGQISGEELVRELNLHNCMVVPSRWAEPFGNVALEGAACGCVVIGSDAGGLPDAIGPAGLLFKPGDVADLAAKMRSILTETELAARLRDRGRAHLACHTETHVGARYLGVLQRVFDRRYNNRP